MRRAAAHAALNEEEDNDEENDDDTATGGNVIRLPERNVSKDREHAPLTPREARRLRKAAGVSAARQADARRAASTD
eukprot:COSAG01_NODE_6868_length_3464_cov_9.347994_3_plen_77_part_00